MNNSQNIKEIPNPEQVREQLSRINKSQALGRSKVNKKLLDFLVNYYLTALEQGNPKKAPKEIEIAVGALGKNSDFNPAEDASIRVYISNLRKKLETYYKTEGADEAFQICIPPGGYGLEFLKAQPQPESRAKKPAWFKRLQPLVVASVLLNVVFVLYFALTAANTEQTTKNQLSEHAVWQPLFLNNKSTLIVIGDLYMLTEVDPQTNIVRAVREFSVNSDKDFADYLKRYPVKRDIMQQAKSAFLLKNSVFALQHLLPLFTDQSKTMIKLASNLTPADLRDYNVIYLGLYKSLGMLDAYLHGSNFAIQRNPLALKHKNTGKLYPIIGDLQQEYTDFGTFAKFNGPSGNYFYILAGFSDASVIQMAKYLTSSKRLYSDEFAKHLPLIEQINANYELVFSASSFDRTDLDSNLVDGAAIDIKSIWSMP